jgi:membrane protein required for colicin V production
LSWIDIFIVIVFAYNLFLGLSNGLLKSLFGIGAFIVATSLAPAFQGIATNLISDYFTVNQELTKILGLGFSWFFIYVVLNIAASIIIKNMEKTPLKVFDRLAGLFVGLFMSVVIVVVPLLIMKAIPVVKEIPQVKAALKRSALLPLFEPISVPFQDVFAQALKEQKEELMKRLKGEKTEKTEKIPGNRQLSKEQEIKNIMKEYNISPLGTSKPGGAKPNTKK